VNDSTHSPISQSTVFVSSKANQTTACSGHSKNSGDLVYFDFSQLILPKYPKTAYRFVVGPSYSTVCDLGHFFL